MRTTKIIISVFKKRLIVLLTLLMVTNLSSAQETAFLTDIVHSTLPGGNVQINIVADGELDKPGSFSTDKPARIAIDFFGAKRDISSAPLKINRGKVESCL